MAKAKETKFDHKSVNVDELRKRLDKTQQDLFKVRFRAASAPVTNTMQIRTLRREIARINTFISQKATAENTAAVETKQKGGKNR